MARAMFPVPMMVNVLEQGRPDVFIAGDDAQAKADVAAFVESLGLRPRDVGGLKMAHWLEGMGLVTVGEFTG
jgi:predicted dinucleotide-binding enzyme